ncbi:ParB N-terminal domain-containing protein [Pseudoalteromonas luteoviolacea]|uniref:ParB N-terminal domain-containing protein n=1 Tax=Pseudoalteromonas luteoviolacea TaxID=43657 RepID=UPI001B39FC53|nr:ParB N-terminal domain-containing protein [Pseudoalteromonas luteoviolacea]MBQ4877863.1 ParB N-terminal domain-containing protein [Pseudoalteromonas luteoviolacea]MBQ4906898.1 ParB N-terminal domain-containing protein [Pseudoalteromonas luteoviolacea]
MARKRKNDTRLDPFATPVENSSLDDLLGKASVGDVITMPSPSDPQRMINLKCEVIPHSKIDEKTVVFGQNRREQSLLSEKSVADILPAIKADGKNMHPALCWSRGNETLVLSGSRRRKACLLAGADYVVLTSDDFTSDDAKALAVSSDQYIAPSLWELGKAYDQTRQKLIETGNKGSYREIAAIEGVSHTAVADAVKAFKHIDKEIVLLYPTPNHLGREVAKKLINACKDNPEQFTAKLKSISNQSLFAEQMSDEKRAIEITKYLTTFEASSANRSESLLENEYVKVQRSLNSGAVTVKIDDKVLTDKRLEQLQKLLNSFN